MGHDVDGLDTLLAHNPCPIHVHKADADMVQMMTGVSASDLTTHSSGDMVSAGQVEVELLHTPGHTEGSQCFRCKQALIAGDTLFLQGCGRLDLPGSSVDEMWNTLTQRLSTLPGDTILYPGHDYGDRPSAPMSEVRVENPYLRIPDIDTWRQMMGR
jgi:glyoxylase-like metal-dependent hydrolase (beta-lactamase superfamily II)